MKKQEFIQKMIGLGDKHFHLDNDDFDDLIPEGNKLYDEHFGELTNRGEKKGCCGVCTEWKFKVHRSDISYGNCGHFSQVTDEDFYCNNCKTK